MTFQILTLFPNFFHSCFQIGLLNRAINKSLINLELIDIKAYAKQGRADDKPFGGGDGMLLCYPVLKSAIQAIKQPGRLVYLSAQGNPWKASKAKTYAKKYSHITLLCGRYAGVDARFIKDFVHEEISVGDYVLNGGESAALILIESISRFINGYLGNQKSSQIDSFENLLLEGPSWTKPRHIPGHSIPKVFLNGHHSEIQKTQFYSSLVLTFLKRRDLLESQKDLLKQLPEAYDFLKTMSDLELQAFGLCKKQDTICLIV